MRIQYLSENIQFFLTICNFPPQLHYLSNWFDRSKNECLGNPCGESSLERFTRQEDHLNPRSFSRTSIKRLISTTSDTDSTTDQRSVPDIRELRDINNAIP